MDEVLSIAGEPGMINNPMNIRLTKAPNAEEYLINPFDFLNPI